MKKINWEPIKDFAEVIGGFVCCGLMVTAARKLIENIDEVPSSAIAGYDDAVGAIMKSGMYSHDKAHAVAALKRNGNSEFYRAIAHIAEDSDMYSHNKVDMIKQLSQD